MKIAKRCIECGSLYLIEPCLKERAKYCGYRCRELARAKLYEKRKRESRIIKCSSWTDIIPTLVKLEELTPREALKAIIKNLRIRFSTWRQTPETKARIKKDLDMLEKLDQSLDDEA